MGKLSERFDKRFEEKYEFRLAKRSDIEAIMTYIDECWKKGHILSWNRELFEYEFCDGEDVHFLLAIDRETGEIEGMDGYYLTSSRKKDFDIWGSMWSVRKDHKNLPMLGISIANHYYSIIGYRYEIGVGVNTITATPIHQKYFKLETGMLNHYYMLHKMKEYQIARIEVPYYSKAYDHADTYRLVRAGQLREVEQAFDFETKITTYPYKDSWYVGHRFFDHPVYEYQVYLVMRDNPEAGEEAEKQSETGAYNGIDDNIGQQVGQEGRMQAREKVSAEHVMRELQAGEEVAVAPETQELQAGEEADAVLVIRDVRVDDIKERHVLRIVDYMGDIQALKQVQSQLYQLMDEACEYIDFYCYGYEEQAILEAGFAKRTVEDVNIIPSYFEPFEQRNVEYWFNSDAHENFVICKADADQDRPNIV